MHNPRAGRGVLPLTLLLALSGVGVPAVVQAASHVDKQEKHSLEKEERESADLLSALKRYTAQQRDEAVKRAAAGMQKLDQRIDALETRIDQGWEKMDQGARDKARASLKALRRQRNEVVEWYGGLQNSSAEAWEHVKQGFSQAYTALGDAWEKADKEFEERR